MSLFEDSKQRADRLYQQGLEYYQREQFEPAAENFQQALDLYQQSGDRLGEAKCLYNLGLIRTIQGDRRTRSEFVQADEDYRQAKKAFEAALQIYREIGKRKMEANSLYRLGIVYASQGKYREATQYYQQALTIYRELGDREGEANAQSSLKKASWYLKGDKTSPEPSQSPKFYSAQKSTNQGTSPSSSRKPSPASSLSSSSSPYSGSSPQSREEYLQLANYFYEQSLQLIEQEKFQAALAILLRVVEIYQRFREREGEASGLVELGRVYDRLGQTQQADQCYGQALSIFQELGIDPGSMDFSLGRRKSSYGSIQDKSANTSDNFLALRAAKQTFQQALQLYKQSRFREALNLFQQVLPVCQNVGDRDGGDFQHPVDQQFQKGLQLYREEQLAATEIFHETLESFRQLGDRPGEANSLYNLGLIWMIHDYSDAKKFFEEARKLYQRIGNRKMEANTLRQLGVVHVSWKKYEQATKYYQQALTLYQELGERDEEANVKSSLQEAFGSLTTKKAASAGFRPPLTFEFDHDYRDEDFCLLSDVLRPKDYPYSFEDYQQRFRVSTQRDVDASYEILFLLYDVDQLIERFDFRSLLKVIKARIDLCRMIGDLAGEARLLIFIGFAYYKLERNSEGEQAHEQAKVIYQRLGTDCKKMISTFIEQNLSIDLGKTSEKKSHEQKIKTAQVSEIVQRMDSLFNKEPDSSANSLTSQNIDHILQQGRQLYSQYRFAEALEVFQQVLRIYHELGNHVGEVQCLNHIGETYYNLGHYTNAIESYAQSLQLACEIGDRQSESGSLSNLGVVYKATGQHERAIEYHEQSLLIKREISDRQGEAHSLLNLGNVYEALGQYEQGIEFCAQSLQMAREIHDRRSESASLCSLGNVYKGLGQYALAIEHCKQGLQLARDIGDYRCEAYSLSNLGNIYKALGQYTRAIEYHTQSLQIKRNISDRQGEASSLSSLGTIYLDVLESLRQNLTDEHKVSFFETLISPYTTLQQVLVAQGKSDMSLEIAERGRGRAFVELLAKRISPDQFDDLLHSQIAQPPSLAKIQQLAQTHCATLVEYSIVEQSALYVWVVKPTGKISFRQIDLSSLKAPLPTLVDRAHLKVASGRELEETEAAIETLVRGVHADPLEITRDDASAQLPAFTRSKASTHHLQQLYQLLIEPIADLLPAHSNQPVIFIPHRVLFLVPFAALQDANGKYLIEKHLILTAPSIQVLDLTRQQRQQLGTSCKGWGVSNAPSSLVVGNPTMPSVGYPPRQLTPLPGAEEEATAIARFFYTQALIGDRATETEVIQRMETAQIIHLATHGLLNQMEDGVPGAIALAPSGDKDGLLTANDILDLHLQAELVVLSGCNTGRGQITGDGVVGLSRAFMTAGVPSVIVTLWSIPDAPTASLMTEFYRNWQQGLDKAQALRQAMLTTMQSHPHPRDWAAFTLMGEAD